MKVQKRTKNKSKPQQNPGSQAPKTKGSAKTVPVQEQQAAAFAVSKSVCLTLSFVLPFIILGTHVKRMNDFLQKYGKIIPQERG